MDDDSARNAALNRLVADSMRLSELLQGLANAQVSDQRTRVAALVRFEDARTAMYRAARDLAPLLGAAAGGATGPGSVRTWPQSLALREAVAAASAALSDEALDARRAGIRAVANEMGRAKTAEAEGAALAGLRDPDTRTRVSEAAMAMMAASVAHSERDRMAIYREAAASAGVNLTITESIVSPDGTSVDWDITDADPVG